jgi:phospholipid N-methyltransferase
MGTDPPSSDTSASVSVSEFMRHPSMVGSAFPATKRMVRRLLKRINWSAVDVLVEYGPGTGRFTATALAKLKRSGTLIAIETGEDFVEHLRSSLGDDDRLSVVQGSAADVIPILKDHGLEHVDCIISGLPFSTLSAGDAEQIVSASATALHPSGMFAVYQMRSAIDPLLHRHFSKIAQAYEWWNIPPCHLYWAKDPIVR